ncbi:MAG: acyltransferase family protein [Aristaeellaceae bacterium]
MNASEVTHMRDAPYSSQRNSFHLMRLGLAVTVILCHAYTLKNLTTPLHLLTGGQLNEGMLAVDGFLVISGFLICQSCVRARNVLVFLRNRILRIYPALVCALAFTALIVGGLAYDGTYAQYLHSGQGGPFSYILNWLTLNVTGDQWGIRGVFEGSVKTGVNVSLWTIKHEISLYLVMALLRLTTLHRRRPAYIVASLFFLTLYILYEGFDIVLWDVPDQRFWVLSHWNYPHFVETGLFFFLGTVLYAYRQQLPRRWYLAVIAVLALMLGGILGVMRWVYVLALPYLVCYLACSPLCAGFSRMGDLSLGLYVYSYPIQQLLYHIAPGMHPLANLALTLVLVLPLAGLSWKYIEAPALRLKTLGQKQTG